MYCSVCRKNFFNGRKHFYSIRHRMKASLSVTSFSEIKIALLEELLPDHTVPDTCLICNGVDIPKVSCGRCREDMPKSSSFVHHLGEALHVKNSRAYLQVAGLTEIRVEDVSYAVHEIEYVNCQGIFSFSNSSLQYHTNCRFFKSLADDNEDASEKVKEPTTSEVNTPAVVDPLLVVSPSGILQHPHGCVTNAQTGTVIRVWGGGIVPMRNAKVSTSARTWACDRLETKYLETYANTVDYDVLPPWLLSDSDSDDSSEGDDTSLPNFGRTWSIGTRAEQQRAFQDGMGRKRKRI